MWKIIWVGKLNNLEYTESSDIAYESLYEGADVYKMKVDEIIHEPDASPNVIFKWVKVHPTVKWENY